MPSIADLISTIHMMALSAFVGGTSVAMLVAVISRLRIRRSLLTWRSGPLTPVPLGPSLFLLLVAAGLIHAWGTGRSVPLAVLLGYPAGGVFWFVATWLLQTVVVTEYGVMHDLSRPNRAVAWGQVFDYFMVTRSGQHYFVFVYRGADGTPHRVDLRVPEARVEALHEIVRRKLDSRFAFSVKQSYKGEVIDRIDDQIDLL